MKTIEITLDDRSIEKAIRNLEIYQVEIQEKANKLCERLMQLGAERVEWNFGMVSPFESDKGRDYEVSVTNDGKTWTLTAGGTEVLFLEFGSGLIGGGHPEPHGYGPGKYPGDSNGPAKGHWNDPRGWHTPKGQRSFGNPPAMGFYDARNQMIEELVNIAEEIFRW